MTNLALDIQNDPEGVRSLKKVVSMGGVFFNVGNVGPDMEFNVGADPDAAFEVVRFCRDSCGAIFPDDRPTRNPAEEVIGIAKNVEREAFEEFFLMRLV